MNKYIFCDIDSTLHDYEKILYSAVYDLHGIKIPSFIFNKYKLEDNKSINISPDQVDEAIRLTDDPSYIKMMIPYDNALNVINNWKDLGHKVVYVTARSEAAYIPLLNWLIKSGFIEKSQKNNIMGKSDLYCFNSITRGEDRVGSSEQKVEFAVTTLMIENKIGIIIDDNPKVLKLASYTVDLLPATVLHPWNKTVVDEYNIPSGKNWIDLSTEISKVYGLKSFKHSNHKKAV